MTATTLERPVPTVSEAPTSIARPPTLFGQNSPWPLVQAGHALASRALACALQDLPRATALALLGEQTSERDVAQMADHYLAFTRFEVPSTVQTQALFLVEDLLNEIDQRQRQQSQVLLRLARWWRELIAGLVRGPRPRTPRRRPRPAV